MKGKGLTLSMSSIYQFLSITMAIFFCFLLVTTYDVSPINDVILSEDITSDIPTSIDHSILLSTSRTFPQILQQLPTIPSSYLKFSSLLDIITQWNPDTADPPSHFKEILQHFDYNNISQRLMAEKFRNAEIAFKLYNVPEVNNISLKWNDHYLLKHMKQDLPNVAHVEESKSNHFMYWNYNKDKGQKEYKSPTTLISMDFQKWLHVAKLADKNKIKNSSTHYYFMVGVEAKDNLHSFISKDLNIFSSKKNNFFISNIDKNKGIQCRFAMRGTISEAHFDSGRNMIAMIRGSKRYILAPPQECKKLGIISDMKHPSYRHSVIDWSDLDQAKSRGFASVNAVETIVNTGEVLYIPSYWFHYIVSLKYSIQCNSRSGSPPHLEGQADIDDCLGKQQKLSSKQKKFRKNKSLRRTIKT